LVVQNIFLYPVVQSVNLFLCRRNIKNTVQPAVNTTVSNSHVWKTSSIHGPTVR
jgi:hypothetical protein